MQGWISGDGGWCRSCRTTSDLTGLAASWLEVISMNNLEKRIQVGACSASIFVNEVETLQGKVPMRSVVLQRTYKDKEDKYQHANNYGVNDIPKAVLALIKAYEHIVSTPVPEYQGRYRPEDNA
jgi:hypothetical protein